mgnify:CR=1 FL=1
MKKKLVTKNLHMECQSEEGITIALIDGMFATIDILCQRDLNHPDVQEALKDFFANAQWRYLLRGIQELDVMPLCDLKSQTYHCSFEYGCNAPLGKQLCDQWATHAVVYNDGTVVERCENHMIQECLPYWKRILSGKCGR